MRDLIGFVPWNLYTLAGMSVVAGLLAAPLTFILCIGSLRLIDASMEDAARSLGAKPPRNRLVGDRADHPPGAGLQRHAELHRRLELLSIPLIFGRPARMLFFTTYLYNSRGGSVPDYALIGAAATFFWC